jgi:hypothetical protein
MLSLGAINKRTGEYIFPKIANKKDEYICPECNKDLILCQGKIKKHHFRHKVDSIQPCHHYNKPTESQIHKDAKMLMKFLLENKMNIQFIRECVSCKENNVMEIPEITEESIVSLEYRFNYKDELKIADVIHTINDEIKCIFEICNTHKTCGENRPEPWFEIDANNLIKIANDNTLSQIQIPCIRNEKCSECIEKEICIACGGSGTSYWGDDCDGSCLECCCINCENFNYECTCVYESKTDYYEKLDNFHKICIADESDNYCCHSIEMLDLFTTIVFEGDCYKKWKNTFGGRARPDEYFYEDSEYDYFMNYLNNKTVKYNIDVINDIHKLKLYNYIIKLEIIKGGFNIIMKNNQNIDCINTLLLYCYCEIFGGDKDWYHFKIV